jgi:hypothetical protein
MLGMRVNFLARPFLISTSTCCLGKKGMRESLNMIQENFYIAPAVAKRVQRMS